MKDKQYYRNQFREILNKPCLEYHGKWYNGDYEWRLVFDFRKEKNRYLGSLENGWSEILHFCKMNDVKFRRRREAAQVIFTSDLIVLDYILENPNIREKLLYIEFTSDSYTKELENLDQLSTDVKIVRSVPKFRYQITLGGFGWNKKLDTRIALTEYILNNKELFDVRGYSAQVLDRARKTKGQYSQYGTTVFDGFQFYAADLDDIMTLHILAPGNIKKVTKLVAKGSKHNES